MKALHFATALRTKRRAQATAQAHIRYIMRTQDQAGEHAAYVTRSRGHVREDLVATGAGNLPEWAQGNPITFFTESDTWERANGRTAIQITAALPRELSHAQQQAAVEAFVTSQLGTKHAYVWGIHETVASDGGRYPHVHIAFSERVDSGRHLAPHDYFSRGGNQKDARFHSRQWPYAARQAWSDTLNVALEASGSAERVSARSFRDQGLTRTPAAYFPREKNRGQEAKIRARHVEADTPEMLARRRQEWDARKRELGITRGMGDEDITRRIGDASRAYSAAEHDRKRVVVHGWNAEELAARQEQVRALREREEYYATHPHQLRTPAHLAAIAKVLHEDDQEQGRVRRRRWAREDEQGRGRSHAREW